MNKVPKLSIITVNLNNKDGLKKTLASVSSQTCRDFEYIVVDGASTDGSTEIISENSQQITRWLSEKDRGIYDAMNKGIQLSEGEYCLFMNAGDTFLEKDSLEKALEQMAKNPADIISYSVIYDYGHRHYEHAPPKKINFGHFFIGGLHHQGTLIRRELFNKIGLYDTSFRIAADWAFFVTAIFKNNATVSLHQFPLTRFDTTGITMSQAGKERNNQERTAFLQSQFPLFYDDYVLLNDDVFKYLLRFPIFLKITRMVLKIALVPLKAGKRVFEVFKK